MGYYDDDGSYHPDAYDDDHLDLQDIGKFCEQHFSRRGKSTTDLPPDMTDDERMQNEQAAYEVPEKEDANGLYGIVGTLLGLGIDFLLSRIFGYSILRSCLLVIGGNMAGRLYQRIHVDEMEMQPKELLLLCFSEVKIKQFLVSVLLYLLYNLVYIIRYG